MLPYLTLQALFYPYPAFDYFFRGTAVPSVPLPGAHRGGEKTAPGDSGAGKTSQGNLPENQQP